MVDTDIWGLKMKNSANIIAQEQDLKNHKKIDEAFNDKRIDEETRDYLNSLYHDGMNGFRNNFYFLGLTLGAPKTPIYTYDPSTDKVASDAELEISDVGASGTYIVHHRFDTDPMRNQFFTFNGGTEIKLLVSSIVTVIVGAQKSIGRALDKITGKYYDDYLEDVLDAVSTILQKYKKSASIKAMSDKITVAFRETFISNSAPEVLKIIGTMFPQISVDLVRELDRIVPPYKRLNDVYRMKLLFDTVPQVNAFIDNVRSIMPDRILSIKNKFYDLDNERGYRDAKIIASFEQDGKIVPMEIICNVRTFFNAERQSHTGYEDVRRASEKSGKKISKNTIGKIHHSGVVAYNTIICRAVSYLFQRVGWNIMYEKDLHIDSFFRGFPKISNMPYDQRIVDIIMDKIDNSVENEVFCVPNTPRQLSEQEQISVFHYMTQFILFAALPYSYKCEEIQGMGFSGELFNFVMRELYRYYENDVL